MRMRLRRKVKVQKEEPKQEEPLTDTHSPIGPMGNSFGGDEGRGLSLDDLKLPSEDEIKKKQESYKVSPASSEEIPADSFLDLTKPQGQAGGSAQVETADLPKLRKMIVRNIVGFERMMFKGVTDKDLGPEDLESLETGWKMCADIYINDVNAGPTMAIFLLALAHAGVVGVHWDDIQEGLERKKRKKKARETIQTPPITEPSLSPPSPLQIMPSEPERFKKLPIPPEA